ncbi:MAG: HAMP domain-containing protein [Burkholderiales bacterium]|nr:MAG: HAMP domain-containing protein [Burkholderiales bacterium]
MPTGAKLFLILVGALLPLALITLFITIQTTQTVSNERRERLRAMAEESSGTLHTVLTNHIAQLTEGLTALETNPNDAPACTRLAGTFGSQGSARFAIISGAGKILCGERFSVSGVAMLNPAELRARIVENGLSLRIGGNDGASAVAFYPGAVLNTIARPNGFVPEYALELTRDSERLQLRALPGAGVLDRRETVRDPIDVDDLAIDMSVPGTPITSPLIISTVLMVIMWIASAAIGWAVVDSLLIRPLRRLRASVGEYNPGEVLDIKRIGELPAQEIRDLGETFREITRTVQVHEADLAEGLVRQTKLTREVHHRVKNNLQVIASLINFHARGAKSAEASEAYASIQRRVDALAVVHRNHYAEMEENRGLELRSVIGELAANIRATAPEHSAGLGITIETEPVLVNQDVATAIAFLLTEIIELAMNCMAGAQIRISVKAGPEEDRATLRVVSPALVESPELVELLENRYGRVLGGLARQLRTKLHHDPLVGAYEASIAITGKTGLTV